jgi:hypothetical protein
MIARHASDRTANNRASSSADPLDRSGVVAEQSFLSGDADLEAADDDRGTVLH